MKTISLILLFLFLSFQNCIAQPSQVFPTENAYWEVGYICWGTGNGIPTHHTETYSFFGDTLVDNYNYSMFSGPLKNDFGPALMEVVEEKVYYREWKEPGDTTRILMYDFGLNVGDVFYYPYINDSTVIEAVDTIQFLDGIPRKRLTLSRRYMWGCGDTYHWVEGIGGMNNPFYFYNCFECDISSLSFYENGELVHYELILDDDEIELEESISIFPNPVNDILEIKSDYHTIDEILMTDLRGQEFIHQIINDKNFTLNIPSYLSQGIYMVQLKLANGQITNRKIVIL